MSTSLQTILAADAHLAEGQFLHDEETLNNAKYYNNNNNNNNNNTRNNSIICNFKSQVTSENLTRLEFSLTIIFTRV
jgi:hypothetical protein